MRRLRIALTACALVAAPVGLLAQQVAPPIARPAPPARPPGNGNPGTPGKPGNGGRPQPRPSGYNPNRNNNYNNGYVPYVYIDGTPYLATPTPKPNAKQTPAHHNTNNGQEVFSTYSTNNAK